jgi:hypothetical protein
MVIKIIRPRRTCIGKAADQTEQAANGFNSCARNRKAPQFAEMTLHHSGCPQSVAAVRRDFCLGGFELVLDLQRAPPVTRTSCRIAQM